ncbi:MAG: short-chain dehydrogenase [Gammaproteobacteria bacterium]|nr:MAG: short-chain dehydrogenase [Gammaproteobacteria bacterium]
MTSSSPAAEARCALVTGTSRGIGRAIAERLLTRGHAVVGLARGSADIAHPAFHEVTIDLADLVSLPGRIDGILAEHPIDALICNAGAGRFGTLETFSARQIEAAIALNLVSPLVVCRQCVARLRQTPRSDIVFIGSESALRAKRQGSLYSAAKFGLRGAAQALRDELAGSNCHVGIVQPGMVRSSFFDTLNFEPGPETAHALVPSDVADAVMQLLDAPDHAIIEELVVKPRQHVVNKRPQRNL